MTLFFIFGCLALKMSVDFIMITCDVVTYLDNVDNCDGSKEL